MQIDWEYSENKTTTDEYTAVIFAFPTESDDVRQGPKDH